MKCTECGAEVTEIRRRKWGKQCSMHCFNLARNRKPILERMMTREQDNQTGAAQETVTDERDPV